MPTVVLKSFVFSLLLSNIALTSRSRECEKAVPIWHRFFYIFQRCLASVALSMSGLGIVL